MKMKYSHLIIKNKDINEEKKTITAVFSTKDVDRHGESVDQKTWILDDFLANPVLMFGHDHSQPPIGKVNNLGYDANGNLAGEVQFAADEYPFANVIWQLYKGGFMRAFSVGFSAGKVDIVNDQVVLKDNVLYEISTVNVPANAMALAKSKGINIDALETKYLEETETSEEVSDEEIDEALEDIAEEVEEKSSIAEEVAANNSLEDKLKMLEPMHDIMNAFYSLVWDDNTTVDDIPKLLKELGALINALAEGQNPADYEKEDAVEVVKAVKEKKIVDAAIEHAKTLMTITKAGKVLSTANRQAIESAITALQAVLDADTGPQQEEEKTIETPSADSTDEKFIQVETPTVRVAVSKKTHNKTKLINKAIRALLAEKKAKH